MADTQINAHFDHVAQTFTLDTQDLVLLRYPPREFTFPIPARRYVYQVPRFKRLSRLISRRIVKDSTLKYH